MWQQILSFFKSQPEGDMAANFYLGESLVGDGNEIAHIDLIIGEKAATPAPRSATPCPTTRTASPPCSRW